MRRKALSIGATLFGLSLCSGTGVHEDQQQQEEVLRRLKKSSRDDERKDDNYYWNPHKHTGNHKGSKPSPTTMAPQVTPLMPVQSPSASPPTFTYPPVFYFAKQHHKGKQMAERHKDDDDDSGSSKKKSSGKQDKRDKPKRKKMKGSNKKDGKAPKLNNKKGGSKGDKKVNKKPKNGDKRPHPPTTGGSCASPVAEAIMEDLQTAEQVVLFNPDYCCDSSQPTAVYVTHARLGGSTETGLESSWDVVYTEIAERSAALDECFVFTSFNTTSITPAIETALVEVTTVASQTPDVRSMMVSDPSNAADLITVIRTIALDAMLPPIGVFVAGYNNIVVESIVSGLDRLPFIGNLDESGYGSLAANIIKDRQSGSAPLCYYSGDVARSRCPNFYSGLDATVSPQEGLLCTGKSTMQLISELQGRTAVWASADCCAILVPAVEELNNDDLLFGCADAPHLASPPVNFVTSPSLRLQAAMAYAWASTGVQGLPFPDLQSVVNVEVESTLVL